MSDWYLAMRNFVRWPTIFNWNDVSILCAHWGPKPMDWPLTGRKIPLLEGILLNIPNAIARYPDELYVSIYQKNLIGMIFSIPALRTPETLDYIEPTDLATSLKRVAQLRAEMENQLNRIFEGELYPAAFMDVIRETEEEVRRRYKAIFTKAKQRCACYKEELIAAAWAPARVERWVEAGIDIEAL